MGTHQLFLPVALILAKDERILDRLLADRTQGMQNLELFRVHIRADIIAGPLHRHDRENLEQMVLHHVFHGAGFVIIAAAGFDANVLQRGDLHGFNEARIPQVVKIGLEKRIVSMLRTISLPR